MRSWRCTLPTSQQTTIQPKDSSCDEEVGYGSQKSLPAIVWDRDRQKRAVVPMPLGFSQAMHLLGELVDQCAEDIFDDSSDFHRHVPVEANSENCCGSQTRNGQRAMPHVYVALCNTAHVIERGWPIYSFPNSTKLLKCTIEKPRFIGFEPASLLASSWLNVPNESEQSR